MKTKMIIKMVLMGLITASVCCRVSPSLAAGTLTLDSIKAKKASQSGYEDITSRGYVKTNQEVVFVTRYTNPRGIADIKTCQLYVTNTVSACYETASSKLYLYASDEGTLTRSNGFVPQSSNVISAGRKINGKLYKAELNCAGTIVTKSGNTLTIRWAITFKTPTDDRDIKMIMVCGGGRIESALNRKWRAGADLIDNSDFTYGYQAWGYPDESMRGEIGTSGEEGGNYLNLSNHDNKKQFVWQRVYPLPGRVYKLSALLKTSPRYREKGYIILRDETSKKEFVKKCSGNGHWKRIVTLIKIPADAAGHKWCIYLRNEYGLTKAEPLFFDDVSIKLIPELKTTEIEELSDCWEIKSVEFKKDGVEKPLPGDRSIIEWDNGIINVKGLKNEINTYSIDIPVDPGSKYKISADVEVLRRLTYNYLNGETWNSNSLPSALSSIANITKGIYGGKYFLKVTVKDAEAADLLQPIWVNNANIVPNYQIRYSEEGYFQTSSSQDMVTISIKLEGIEGEMQFDNINLEKVDSVIDEYLNIPVNYKFQGMAITGISNSEITTNAGQFVFLNDRIRFIKGAGAIIGEAVFPTDFLEGIEIKPDQTQKMEGQDSEYWGTVYLENDNVALSVGADSSIIVKLKRDADIEVSTSLPLGYNRVEAGVIFWSDYEKGLFFSPLRPSLSIKSMPFTKNRIIKNTRYDDNTDFDDRELRNQTMVLYSFKAGDGFIASIFPPKDFDRDKYKNELAGITGINLNEYTDKDYSYYIQKFAERQNILLLWAGAYNSTKTKGIGDDSPPATDSSGAKVYPRDIAGPYSNITAELYRFIKAAHNHNPPVKVILYMSPEFYYTSTSAPDDPDKLLLDIKNVDVALENYRQSEDPTYTTHRDDNNIYMIDGVYFDGLYEGQPLKCLKLVRGLRNLLKDKFYAQHESWIRSLIRETDHFRVPFLDAYADHIYLGEAVKKSRRGNKDVRDMLYANRGLSNTISTLFPEIRDVAYYVINRNDDEKKSADNRRYTDLLNTVKNLSTGNARDFRNYTDKYKMPVAQQITNQIDACGKINVPAFAQKGAIIDNSFVINNKAAPISEQYDVMRDYWNKFYDKLFSSTGLFPPEGDNYRADGTYLYYPEPVLQGYFSISKDNKSKFTCGDSSSVAQWIFDGYSLYKLHFTFDGPIISDDSGHRMGPSEELGIKYTNVPTKDTSEPGAFRFDRSQMQMVFGYTGRELNLTAKSFSSFARIKTESAATQIIFSLNGGKEFYYGIYNGEFTVFFNYGNSRVSGGNIGDGRWHTVGIVCKYKSNDNNGNYYYDACLYVDGVKKVGPTGIQWKEFADYGSYTIGAQSQAALKSYFNGSIDDLFVTTGALDDTQAKEYNSNQFKSITRSGVTNVRCIINKKDEQGNMKKFIARYP